MESLLSTFPLLRIPPSQLNEHIGTRKWITRDARDSGQLQTRLINLTTGAIEKGFPSSIPHSIHNPHELNSSNTMTHDSLEIYPHSWNHKIQNYLSQKMNKFYSTNVPISRKISIFEHVVQVLDSIYNAILDYQEYPYMFWYQIENFRNVIYHVEQIITKWKLKPHSKVLEKKMDHQTLKQVSIEQKKEEEMEEENQILQIVEEEMSKKMQQFQQKIVSHSTTDDTRRELAKYVVSYCFEEKRKEKEAVPLFQKDHFEDCFNKRILFFSTKKTYQRRELISYFENLMQASQYIPQLVNQVCQWVISKHFDLPHSIQWKNRITKYRQLLHKEYLQRKQKMAKQNNESTKFEDLLETNDKGNESNQRVKERLLRKYNLEMYGYILKELSLHQKDTFVNYIQKCQIVNKYQQLLQESIRFLKQASFDVISSKRFDKMINQLVQTLANQQIIEGEEWNIQVQMDELFAIILPIQFYERKVNAAHGSKISLKDYFVQQWNQIEPIQKMYKYVGIQYFHYYKSQMMQYNPFIKFITDQSKYDQLLLSCMLVESNKTHTMLKETNLCRDFWNHSNALKEYIKELFESEFLQSYSVISKHLIIIYLHFLRRSNPQVLARLYHITKLNQKAHLYLLLEILFFVQVFLSDKKQFSWKQVKHFIRNNTRLVLQGLLQLYSKPIDAQQSNVLNAMIKEQEDITALFK